MKIKGMYRCCECGMAFKEEDIHYVEESRGEFWGAPCWETMSYSPCCDGDFVEYEINGLYKCKDCGKIYDAEDIDIEIDQVGSMYEVQLSCPDCLGEVEEYEED